MVISAWSRSVLAGKLHSQLWAAAATEFDNITQSEPAADNRYTQKQNAPWSSSVAGPIEADDGHRARAVREINEGAAFLAFGARRSIRYQLCIGKKLGLSSYSQRCSWFTPDSLLNLSASVVSCRQLGRKQEVRHMSCWIYSYLQSVRRYKWTGNSGRLKLGKTVELPQSSDESAKKIWTNELPLPPSKPKRAHNRTSITSLNQPKSGYTHVHNAYVYRSVVIPVDCGRWDRQWSR